MRVETKKIYTFEEGDVVVSNVVNHVAIRIATGMWKHTNSDFDSRRYTDQEIETSLEDGSWVYFGNRHHKMD